MRATLYVSAIFFLILAFQGLLGLRSELTLSAVEKSEEQLTHTLQRMGSLATDSTAFDLSKEIEMREKAKSVSQASSRAFLLSSRLWYRLAGMESDDAKRLHNYCLALADLAGAVEREPYNVRYLMSYANVRQLLGGAACETPHTDSDFREVSKLALKRDPTNTDMLYTAAQIHLWSGDRETSLGLLHQFLRYSTNVTSGQERFILSQMINSQDVEAIVPARFPQVLRWSGALQAQRPTVFSAVAPALSKLQRAALKEGNGELEA